MYRPYREAIQEVLPHVIHVVISTTLSGWATKPWSAFGDGSRTPSHGKLNLQLKRERKLLTMRQHELTDFQWLAVSGWLNNFPQLKLAYELKECYFKIWDCATPEEDLAEFLRWQESIPNDLAKPFRAITTAWRTWRKQILAYFECPITNALLRASTRRFGKPTRRGNGYSFEVLRAKVLFSDMLQKKARKVEQVKVKKRPRFDDVPHDLCGSGIRNPAGGA